MILFIVELFANVLVSWLVLRHINLPDHLMPNQVKKSPVLGRGKVCYVGIY